MSSLSRVDSPWMSIDAACAYAGVGRKILYAAVSGGQLKAARIGLGRNLRFHRDWIDDFLRAAADEPQPLRLVDGDRRQVGA